MCLIFFFIGSLNGGQEPGPARNWLFVSHCCTQHEPKVRQLKAALQQLTTFYWCILIIILIITFNYPISNVCPLMKYLPSSQIMSQGQI